MTRGGAANKSARLSQILILTGLAIPPSPAFSSFAVALLTVVYMSIVYMYMYK